jgi:hypothetical protein
MLTAGISTSAVTRELNVNISTINCLQNNFKEFSSTSKWKVEKRARQAWGQVLINQ